MQVCVEQNWASPACVLDPTPSGDDDVETAAEEVAAVEAAELVAAAEEVAAVVVAELLVAGVDALPAQALRPTTQARVASAKRRTVRLYSRKTEIPQGLAPGHARLVSDIRLFAPPAFATNPVSASDERRSAAAPACNHRPQRVHLSFGFWARRRFAD